MRSSNKRSRSKSNRNRPSGGNIVNRVFDSSGPEGKVRGTPQQIIDKYNQLTRDAQLSGDRVAAENFAQHAEHYTRMLAEAQREMNERQDQHSQQDGNQQGGNQQGGSQQGGNQQGGNQQGGNQQGGNQQGGNQQGGNQQGGNQQGGNQQGGNQRPDQQGRRDPQDRDQQQPAARADDQGPQKPAEVASGGAEDAPKPAAKRPRRPRKKDDDVIETSLEEESNLVETPESKPKRTRSRKPKPAPEPQDARSDKGDAEDGRDSDAGGDGKTQAVE